MAVENPFFRELKPFIGDKVKIYLTSGDIIEEATLEAIDFKHLSIVVSHDKGKELIRGNGILRLILPQK